MRRLLALTSLLAACGSGTGDVQQLQIRLSFDSLSCFTMECTSPQTCPLDCGGVISVFILSADTGDVIDEACTSFDPLPGQKLDSVVELLNTLQFTSPLAKGTKVDVEINVFDFGLVVADGTTPGTCPRAIEGALVPRYSGVVREFIVGGGSAVVDVPLGCVLNTAGCETPPDILTIRTTVDDVNSLLSVSEAVGQPETLDVRAGEDYPIPMMSGPLHVTLSVSPPLDYVQQPFPTDPALWEITFDRPISIGPACFATVVTRAGPGATAATASCEGAEVIGGQEILARSYFVEKAIVDQVLESLGLPTLPPGGLLIGRVVDEFGSPVAGASIQPMTDPSSAPDVDYFYVDEISGRLRKAAGGPTDETGYFAVVDGLELDDQLFGIGPTARCCDTFVATHTDGRVGFSPGLVGLIDDVVMSTVITIYP